MDDGIRLRRSVRIVRSLDGDQSDCRYDLLLISLAVLEWSLNGSGPAQLVIAMLAHAFDDEFATAHY